MITRPTTCTVKMYTTYTPIADWCTRRVIITHYLPMVKQNYIFYVVEIMAYDNRLYW